MFRIWVRDQIQGSKARLDMELYATAVRRTPHLSPEQWMKGALHQRQAPRQRCQCPRVPSGDGLPTVLAFYCCEGRDAMITATLIKEIISLVLAYSS